MAARNSRLILPQVQAQELKGKKAGPESGGQCLKQASVLKWVTVAKRILYTPIAQSHVACHLWHLVRISSIQTHKLRIE